MKMTKQAYIDFGASDAKTLAKHANPYSRQRYESFVGGTSWQAKAYMAGFNGTADSLFPPAEPIDEQPAAPSERETVVIIDRAHGVPVRMDSASVRECMVRYNRERSQAQRRFAESSDKARTVRAHVAFNLACDQTTYERGCRVAAALAMLKDHGEYYARRYGVKFPARDAWIAAYSGIRLRNR